MVDLAPPLVHSQEGAPNADFVQLAVLLGLDLEICRWRSRGVSGEGTRKRLTLAGIFANKLLPQHPGTHLSRQTACSRLLAAQAPQSVAAHLSVRPAHGQTWKAHLHEAQPRQQTQTLPVCLAKQTALNQQDAAGLGGPPACSRHDLAGPSHG